MRGRFAASSIVALLATAGKVAAQTGPLVMGAGYVYPTPIYVAPGQLITVFVANISPAAPFARAPGNSDLPVSLAGVSADIWQQHVWGAPIVEVRHFGPCLNPNSSCNYASHTSGVTIQVPFELKSQFDVCWPVTGPGCTIVAAPFLYIRASNEVGIIDAIALPDNIHLLRTFDSVLPMEPPAIHGQCLPTTQDNSSAPYNVTGLPCPSLVTHGDGSLVSAKSPAKAGEELVAYAVGLGQTSPPSETGRIVTSPAPTVTTFALDFNYRRNALPTRPPPAGTPGVPRPIYAGRTPGYVGLYQINFVVPPVPPGTPPCAEVDSNNRFENVVFSNLTVSVGGRFSFDGAGICVAVDPPPLADPVDESRREDK